MILGLYKELRSIALSEYGEIIEDAEIIFSYSGRPRKLRITLVDSTFIDVWYSLDGGYSFHWEQAPLRNSIYRHDNAPHKRWSYVGTFPRHCHDGARDRVVESNLSNDPQKAMREFLSIVRKKIIELL